MERKTRCVMVMLDRAEPRGERATCFLLVIRGQGLLVSFSLERTASPPGSRPEVVGEEAQEVEGLVNFVEGQLAGLKSR